MANRWSIRRRRHPRPAVCKESPEDAPDQDILPATIDGNLTWSGPPFPPTSTVIGKTVTCARLPGTQTYVGLASDNQGRPFTCTMQLGLGTTPTTVECVVPAVGVNTLIPIGSEPPWPGTPGYTSPGSALSFNLFGYFGTWHYVV